MNRNLRRALRASSTDGLIFLIILIVCVVAIYSFLFDKKDINDDVYTTLQTATKNCDLETMKSLVKKSRDASNIGERALYYAVQRGCLEIVTFLLDEGVNINAINVALFDAASYGQLEVVKLLLKRGANPLVILKGSTAKTTAIRESFYPINRNNSKKPYDEIIDLLTEAEKNYKLYQFSLLGGQIGDIAELFNYGVGKRGNKFTQSALKQGNCIVYFIAQNVLFYI